MLTWLLLLAIDGGTAAVLSAEDQEVVDNLELLQELDSAADLELLEELGKEN